MEDNARLTAVSILYDMDVNKSYSNLKINEYFVKNDLSAVDRGFSTEIIYGTIRWRLKIDYLIQKNIKSRLDELSPWVLACVRAAVYQIYFMDKVPDFAAVNVAVELVKYKEPNAAAFANGLLRNLLRNRDEFNHIGIRNKTKRLSIEYSHPEWFVKKFTPLFGEEFVKELMATNNTPPLLTARTNTLKIDRMSLIALLAEKGISATVGTTDDAIVFDGYSMIEKSEEFKKGYFIFQDESSMLVAKVLNPKPGNCVIDMCSAPGGKTTHIAQLMKNSGEILAFDIYTHKLSLIEENAKKLGIDIIQSKLGNATEFKSEYQQHADCVLVDAPCSGLGLIRKKPEIRWNVSESDIEQLKILQLKILQNASAYVKIGGSIVYSTCTISEEENEQVVHEFAKKNTDFEFENIRQYLPISYQSRMNDSPYVKLFPNVNNCDGFFISKLKRVR